VQSSSQIVTTNKPTPNLLQTGCPSGRPTNSVKALKGKMRSYISSSVRFQMHLIYKYDNVIYDSGHRVFITGFLRSVLRVARSLREFTLRKRRKMLSAQRRRRPPLRVPGRDVGRHLRPGRRQRVHVEPLQERRHVRRRPGAIPLPLSAHVLRRSLRTIPARLVHPAVAFRSGVFRRLPGKGRK